MTPTDRRQALLTLIAAQLEDARAGKVLKQCGRSIPTVHRVLHAQDHRITTLVDIADTLNCDVVIQIVKRSAA